MTEAIVIDFETYFDRDYSLSKMTTEAYIRDERFEPLVMSIGDYKSERVASAVGPDEIRKWIELRDWSNTVVIAQNAMFDGGILSLRYGVHPKLWICTMSLERGLQGPGKSASLAAMSARYGLPQKTVPYNEFLGMSFHDLTYCSTRPDLLRRLVAGCEHDVSLTRTIARKQLALFPKQELPIIDMTIRMFTEPQLVGDAAALRAIALEEHARKSALMSDLNVTEKELQSADTFVRLLEDCGEDVPVKQGKLKEIPCVSKTDPFMQELSTRGDRAGLLAQARLDVRSTLDENRASRLALSAERGLMPVALDYCGAATTRWSGADKVNWQNLPRSGGLRGSIGAPDGYKLVVADFAQIEYRVLCGRAGQLDKLDDLRAKRDIYRGFGAKLYDKLEAEITKDERQFSKKVVLGCGYGMGVDKFYKTCHAEGMHIDMELADRAVKAYRATHARVVNLWAKCGREGLETLVGDRDACGWGDVITLQKGFVNLPNGMRCPFNVRWDQFERTWKRTTRYGETRYWGGALTEFLCQSLARVIMSDVMLATQKEEGYNPALLVHDELVYVIPENTAELFMKRLVARMSESPAWWPDLPLNAEGWIGDRYGK